MLRSVRRLLFRREIVIRSDGIVDRRFYPVPELDIHPDGFIERDGIEDTVSHVDTHAGMEVTPACWLSNERVGERLGPAPCITVIVFRACPD